VDFRPHIFFENYFKIVCYFSILAPQEGQKVASSSTSLPQFPQ